MHLGQHDIGLNIGEGARSLDRWQLTGIAQHENGLTEGEQIRCHLLTDHGHLVQDDEIGVPYLGLFVENKLRFVDIGQPQFQTFQPLGGKCTLGGGHGQDART